MLWGNVGLVNAYTKHPHAQPHRCTTSLIQSLSMLISNSHKRKISTVAPTHTETTRTGIITATTITQQDIRTTRLMITPVTNTVQDIHIQTMSAKFASLLEKVLVRLNHQFA